MRIETRNPSGEAGVSGFVKVLAGSNDENQNTPNLINLQVEHLRRRFILSPALALVAAEHAFANTRRFG